MKFSATRYPGDGEEDQIVIRMCLKNAAILHEILGNADGTLYDNDGDETQTDPECIVTGAAFEELDKALGSDKGGFSLFDNEHGVDYVDYSVREK